MDPLSITAAVVSFMDLAKRIKDSVDKVRHWVIPWLGMLHSADGRVNQTGSNRRRLKELTNNIVEEVAKLDKYRQLKILCLDKESVCCLESLHTYASFPSIASGVMVDVDNESAANCTMFWNGACKE